MFELHERLAADTFTVTDWPLCRVLLMNDATYPWLVLVPRRPGVVEIHDLEAGERAILMEEMAEAARRLHHHCKADKMNVAALGNVVPQLHVHVIARFAGDAAWPRPVWGVAPARPHGEADLTERLATLRALFA